MQRFLNSEDQQEQKAEQMEIETTAEETTQNQDSIIIRKTNAQSGQSQHNLFVELTLQYFLKNLLSRAYWLEHPQKDAVLSVIQNSNHALFSILLWDPELSRRSAKNLAVDGSE
jgi:hypothetical protein